MNTFKFKTNIKCGGCISNVQPHMDEAFGADNWQVDTSSEDKILTVKTNQKATDVVSVVAKAGYQANQEKKGVFSKLFNK